MSDGPNKAVHNERLKLRAAAMNGVAIAAVVAGFITPLAALTFGLSSLSGASSLTTTMASLAWLIGGVTLHFLAGRVLGGLRE